MEKRIELERRGKRPAQVKDLNLDNCRSTSIVGLNDFVNLESLSLINVGLTSLKCFPELPHLKRLELSDNRISNGLNFLSASPKLHYLNLSGNKIVNLETLEPLKEFSKLKNLDLFNNEVTSIESYRTEVFNLIPSLKYLDGYDQEDNEAVDSDGEEEESSEDEGEEDPQEYGLCLSAVYNDNLDEESSDDEFEANYEEEEDDDDDASDESEDGEQKDKGPQEEPEESTRGKKRKHEEESESNN